MNFKNIINSKYMQTICILIFIIITLAIILLKNNNNGKSNTPTPTSSLLTITINGEKEMTIIQGQEFQDPGCSAYDSIEGDLTNAIIVEGSVNTNVVDSYVIRYTIINSSGNKKVETRTVNVIEDLNIKIDYYPKELTNDDVTITLSITGDCFSSITDPTGKTINNNEIKYPVTDNGEYLFLIERTDGKIINQSIKVDNIDKEKPTGTCNNTITNNSTTIKAEANDNNGIKTYEYKFNGKTKELENNTYTINEIANQVTVTIYDNANNFETINCTKIDDRWPIITNQNYENHSAQNFNHNLVYENRMNYILYYPDNLNLNEKNPLVVFLHGIGEFGNKIASTLGGASIFTNNMKSGKFQQKAIFLAPQCKSSQKKWVDCFDDLKGLIDKIVQEYNVDTNKITMTGHSKGGEATFDFIVRYPGFLSAAAPLAPSSINKDYTKMKDLKIAVFTGTKDELYKPNQTDTSYLINNGVNLRFYPLQDITHSSQKATYNKTNVIDWLISQSK